MRELKLRVKGTSGDKLWVYFHIPRIFDGGSIAYNLTDWETLGRYTGLHDKNGLEIYEGDIVICDSATLQCPHEVYWREAAPFEDMGGWGLKGTTKDYDWVGGEELVGSIYENPELLK